MNIRISSFEPCGLIVCGCLLVGLLGCSKKEKIAGTDDSRTVEAGVDVGVEALTVGADIALFHEKFGERNFVYSLVAPKQVHNDFRYFGFAVAPELTLFTADKDGIVRAIALMRHREGKPSERRKWEDLEIHSTLEEFRKLPGTEWLEMDANDKEKGFRMWADMSSISPEGGVMAFYDETFLGLVIGRQSDILTLMQDFNRSRIMDLRNVEIRQGD